MENQETFFTRLQGTMDSLDYFLHTSKKLAANLGKSFNHYSKPVTIDEGELSKLKFKLEALRVTLKKADGLALADEQDKLWMRELRDLEYRAEDVVEAIEFELLRVTRFEEFKLELIRASMGHKRKRREATTLFASVPSVSLNLKIKRIMERYREIALHRDALRLGEEDGRRRAQSSPLIATSCYPRSKLHGRGKDMTKVIELLLSDDATNHGCVYSVIPIVGMAGVGKTTLVQHIYQEKDIQSKFDLQIWVCMSQQFDVVAVTRKIVEGIVKSPCDLSELSVLHDTLIGHLRGKKFLLVLDDMWVEDPRSWMTLQVPLNHGAEGSKVIVTTRSAKVSQVMCTKRHNLSCLSDDICWKVCSQKAFHCCDPIVDAKLEKIGRRIVARCKGLPLAAEAVGAALGSKVDEEYWNGVSENHLWTEGDIMNQILPALSVSYDYLPLHLKRCFAYCSLFPKGYVFDKERLVQLWIAQGFIEANETTSLEAMGAKYFDDLVQRCFFQCSPSHYHSEETYVMHDLYHELAQNVSGKECNRAEDHMPNKIDEKARHLSLVPQESQSKEVIDLGSFRGQDLRSFLFVGKTESKADEVCFSMNMKYDVFLFLECLRALDLSNTRIEELPSSIGNLIHLRYLSLENSSIKCLPESVGGLFNLQTVNLKHCYCLDELPKGTKLLGNLRHLNLPLSRKCNIRIPSGIGQLGGLVTLTLFVVGSETDGCQIDELGNLVNLRGELRVSGINNVTDAKLAGQANMQNKGKLQKLTLEWSEMGSKVSPGLYGDQVSDVLERLQPHPNLGDLAIKGFCGTRLPTWLGDEYLLKLVTLDLKDCSNSAVLPSLGRLPALKHLSIQSMLILRRIGREFCGCGGSSSGASQSKRGFPMLKTLIFKKMYAWEKWDGVEDGDFPCLQYLTLNRCSKLRELPRIWSSFNPKVTKCPLINIMPQPQNRDEDVVLPDQEPNMFMPCQTNGEFHYTL